MIICGSGHDEASLTLLITKNYENTNSSAVRAAASSCLASLHLKALIAVENDDDQRGGRVMTMLTSLSELYNKTLSKRTRSVVIQAYSEILTRMGSTWINTHHEVILVAILNDLQLTLTMNDRHRNLTTRNHVEILLRKVRCCLDQERQISAVSRILKHLQTAPSRHIIVSSLMEISALITSLGSATPSDLEFDTIYFLTAHPVRSVQVAAACTIKTIVLSVSVLLSSMLDNLFTRLKEELAGIAQPENIAKNLDCLGLALAVAALTSAGVDRPLYISLDKAADQILNIATDTLKASSKSNIHTSAVQVSVAWILIGALQALGPTFVRVHLSQLLLLWKNALPRPLAKDTKYGINLLFLLHVRDTALGSILAFLKNCRPLCTPDVIKRLSTMISNSLAFAQALDLPLTSPGEEKLLNCSATELESYVRRRILACLLEIEKMGGVDLEESGTTALASFADVRSDSTHVLGFVSIWNSMDNFAYGLASGAVQHIQDIDQLLESPILDAIEHDYLHLYVDTESSTGPPPANHVAQLGIDLFAIVFHKQSSQVQESLLAQMATFATNPQTMRNPGRKTALQINCLMAINGALSNDDRGAISSKVVAAMSELLFEGLSSADQFIRNLAAEALGRLSTVGGSSATTNQVNELVDRIVKDRDPHVRAGCSTALGFVHKSLGGIAAVYHLKSILNVLVSLANDPHPVVHYYAVQALHTTIESSGLSFTAHTNSTLSLILKLYVSDVLDPEAGNSVSSNLAIELPHYHALAMCADGLINIIGPDLEDNATARELLLKLVGEILVEKDRRLVADGLICTQHLALFASKQLDLTTYIISLHYHLRTSNQDIKQATVDGLYQLMRVNASEVIRQSSITSRFDTALWLLLNEKPDWQTVKDILSAWLSQTKHEYIYWIELFQQILIRQRLAENNKDSGTKIKLVEQSVEDEGSALGSGVTTNDSKEEILRWQTRLFALQCLHDLVLSVPAKALGERVGDLVRMAFSASTSKVTALQLEGLSFLRSIIAHFKDLRDPDFPDIALLEQHQAQLGSALTPSFSADASPEVAALAVHVCAEFIASGIVEDVNRMGRILRLLTVALESCRDGSESSSFEAMNSYAENAKSMIKISVMSAWAELQVSSLEQEYLSDVMAPYVKELAPMWLESLKDFAQLKFEPTTSGNSMEVQYNTLSRETMVNFYSRAWLNFIHAIATLIDQDKEFIFNALEGRSNTNGNGDIDYRGEPAAFFMVLFGICFEALAHASMESIGNQDLNIRILTAVQSILRPTICGTVVYSEPIFTEIIDLFGRLLLTEEIATQIVIVDIASSLARHHPLLPSSADSAEIRDTEKLQEFVDQLFDLARLMILPLTIVFSWDRNENGKELSRVDASLPKLARSCISNFVRTAELFPPVIKLDLYNSLFHVFGNVFSSANTQATVIPAILPPFKEFVQNVAQSLERNSGDIGMLLAPTRHVLQKLVAISPLHENSGKLVANNGIMASTILMTSLGHLLGGKSKGLSDFGKFVIRHLSDEQTVKAAIWSMKTILTSTDARQSFVQREIIIGLTSFIIHKQAQSAAALNLLFDFGIARQNGAQTLIASKLAFLVPLVIIYDSTTQDSALTRQQISQRMVALISGNTSQFKDYLESVPSAERTALEGIMRVAMEKKTAIPDSGGAPAISLRTAFDF